MPKPNYMKKQTDINHSMRSILVDWLVEVAEEYKLSLQTLYLTINYIDRFLSVMSVLRGKLQLVGTACMLIAAKFEEIYPPDISDFVYITDDTYNAKQVCASNCLWFSSSVSEVQDMLMTNYLVFYGKSISHWSENGREGFSGCHARKSARANLNIDLYNSWLLFSFCMVDIHL